MPPDDYARDAGRHRTFNVYTLECLPDDTASLEAVAADIAYRQDAEFNPELGNISRTYPASRVLRPDNAALTEILGRTAPAFAALCGSATFRVHAHHIRYRARPGRPARNSPAGYHRDGERFISVHLLGRDSVVGGANRIADNAEGEIAEFTLALPGDCFVIDDDRVLHAVDEIAVQPGRLSGTRDILLIDYVPRP
ncbi:MAG: 2OG-Fe dioxygenase family protein [Streptosporangiaceae bacterium]